ncbi:MAG TPA: hypothetical protein VLA98_13350 [Solirubrobacteraceae bacterium]|nr:hypothetical protein [Solirubrobacteraceae bacterium]
MQFLRNVWTDLREKRLWPVALGLIALLAAVPVFLGGGGSSTPAPAPKPANAAPRAAVPAADVAAPDGVVVVGDTTPQPRARGGRLHNPFRQPKPPAPPKADTTAPSGGQSTSSSSPPPSGGTSGDATTTPATPAPAQPEADPYDIYRVDLKFGRADRRLAWIRDIARLTPLPSAKNPFFVFLGVLKDGERAVFLIPSDVQATGDGKCRPSHANCQTIELQAGDTEFFDLVTSDGRSLQYQMDLKSIRTVTGTAVQARAAYTRVSRNGQHVVRRATSHASTAQVRAYHYRPQDGVLVRAESAEAGTAAAPRRYRFGPGEVAAFRSRPAG